MPERRSAGRERFPFSALPTPAGDPVTVVHVSAEYYPYARAGGLAEAVANLARFQSQSGIRTLAIVPLYRSVRERIGRLVPIGDAFEVEIGPRRELVRLHTPSQQNGAPQLVLVEHDEYFDRARLYGDDTGDYSDNHLRFSLFSKACVLALPRLLPNEPVLLHAHDWHAALALAYLDTEFKHDPRFSRIAKVLTVHNAGYQGHLPFMALEELGFPPELFDWRILEWYGQFNTLKAGLVTADEVVTVSPNHARELMTPEGGFGLHEVFWWLGRRFTGILNGIDTATWDPATDREIPARYSSDDLRGKSECKAALQRQLGLTVDPGLPTFVMAARLVAQKGLELLVHNEELFQLPAQFIFLGEGDPHFKLALEARAAAMPGRVAVDTRFSDRLEHQLMAGGDLLLMPCQYEPCGLTQMRAQRYGASPIVRRVGGLANTVDDGITGFVFEPFEPTALVGAALRAIDCFHLPTERLRMTRTAMARDFSWERSVRMYVEVYHRALARYGM